MRILIVEDDPRIAAYLSQALKGSGYVVESVADGEEAWFLGDSEDYGAVILDLGLPGLDGLTVLKRWRANGRTMPVLILTARGGWVERVEGIDAGADDYLPKPFQMEELLARLRALLRRSGGHAAPVIEVDGVCLDERLMRVTAQGGPIALTPLEYRLLSYLMHQRDRVVPQSELAEHVYDHDHDRDNNALEALVSRVRRKVGGRLIQTRRGFGYVIEQVP